MQTRFPPLAALLASLVAGSASAVTGVCPDGSIFIVQSESAIPCPRAKQVDPNDVPPIQPSLLPRPYGWERFNRRSDPNNPYNVVDIDPSGAEALAPSPDGPTPESATPEPAPAPPLATTLAAPLAPIPPTPATPLVDLGLSPREVADLDELVELMQQVAPATLSDLAADGARRASVQIARSAAFEERVHASLPQGGAVRGPVLLFRAEAHADEAFHGNLTFVQGHVAFHPDTGDPTQFGVIDGRLGALAAGERVLGYAVLPVHLDPGAPLDIYWDDRRITATLVN